MARYVFQTTGPNLDKEYASYPDHQIPTELFKDQQESFYFQELLPLFAKNFGLQGGMRILDRQEKTIWTLGLDGINKYAPWLSLVTHKIHYLPIKQ